MKKLFIAIAATALFTSCQKEQIKPAVSTQAEVKSNDVRRGPSWDVINATYTQSYDPLTNYITGAITFSTTWSGTTGTGDIWVARCSSSGVIQTGWSGPYTATNYNASVNTGGRGYATGDKVAILFYPGVPGSSTSYPPYSEIGHVVNSTNDYMDLATVQ